MNKYKEALNYLRNSVLITDCKQKETVNKYTELLQELVDKYTPKNLAKDRDGIIRRPNNKDLLDAMEDIL